MLRPLRILAPLALALGLAVPCAQADEEPRRLAVPADLITRGETTWYGIYFGKSKVGWALRQIGPLDKRGDRFLRSRYVLFMRTKSRGRTKTTRMERRKIYDLAPPHALRGASSLTRRGSSTRRVVVNVRDGKLSAQIEEAEERRRLAVPGAPPTFADETTPAAWIRSRPRVGESLRYRTLDLSNLRVTTSTLRITGLDPARADTYHADRITASGDTDRVRYDVQGAMQSTRMLGVMEIRRETRERAQQLDEAFDPADRGEAQLDRRIGQAEYVRNLVITARGPGVDAVRSGPGQVAAYDAATQTLTLRIGPKLAPAVKATPEEVRQALAETAVYPIRHRVVRALALEMSAKGKTTRAKVEALLTFVQEFVLDSYTADPMTVLDVLEHQEGDCNEHALLFTALARAAGIPAREVYGLLYKDDNKRVFGRHVWNEVVIDGVWVPVDPLWGEMRASAARIRLGARDVGPDLRLALGGARVKLVSVDRDKTPEEQVGAD